VWSGGFGSFLLGMDRKTADKTSTANVPGSNISEPTLGRTMAFFFLVSFVGLLVIVPMRKVRTLALTDRSTIITHQTTGHPSTLTTPARPANRP